VFCVWREPALERASRLVCGVAAVRARKIVLLHFAPERSPTVPAFFVIILPQKSELEVEVDRE